ncbi:AI-2E family transporter [Roseomonas sp. CCTCC AB2023176]|uniref:AI-2E family transporter n=1 Tax=Roseomonas sp. CCTCC AB2023176 TaxID=3342640 RepID=UPI0035E39B70
MPIQRGVVQSGPPRVLLGLCTAILVAAALNAAQAVLAPVAFALFTIAMAWPLQALLERVLPKGLALVVTVFAALVVLAILAVAAGWGFSRVARWVITDAVRLQELYIQKVALAERWGLPLGGALDDAFDARRMVRVAQWVLSQVQDILAFLGVTLVFVILGLLEVKAVSAQLAGIARRYPPALHVRDALRETASKLRTYMLVRTIMSVATGVAVWAFAEAVGLQLAKEWGVIAFVLNYIPFIGPLVATIIPTIFAALQFGTWQFPLLVFAALQAIQFLSGSTIEPLLAGVRLSVSPFAVLVAVFLGALVWAIPGAFIGVPALIGALTLCERFPQAHWVADLLSGRAPDRAG